MNVWFQETLGRHALQLSANPLFQAPTGQTRPEDACPRPRRRGASLRGKGWPPQPASASSAPPGTGPPSANGAKAEAQGLEGHSWLGQGGHEKNDSLRVTMWRMVLSPTYKETVAGSATSQLCSPQALVRCAQMCSASGEPFTPTFFEGGRLREYLWGN